MKAGRPIRFLAIAISGWTAGRAVMLWPVVHGMEAVTRTIAPPAAAMLVRTPTGTATQSQTTRARHRSRTYRFPEAVPIPLPALVVRAEPASVDEIPPPSPPGIIAPYVPVPFGSSSKRFSASAWLIAREGQEGSTNGGQLGGAQLGLRATFLIDRGRRVALSARLSAPLTGLGREAAIGIDWQPLPAPIHVIAERRIALDSGRGGTALLVIGGIGPLLLAPGLRADAYGQAGVIARGGIERFADGAARLSYDIGSLGGVRIDAGAGAWGGAQRGAARLDLGPSIGARVPITGRAVRMTLDCGIM